MGPAFGSSGTGLPQGARTGSLLYPYLKRGLDLVLCVGFLLIAAAIALLLVVLNPLFNPGPLFFRQDRMGRDGRSFRMWKFRTMTGEGEVRRGAFDPVEPDRRTRLGNLLREHHLDELPQILNVIRGEMSVVGPRPDMFDHAVCYLREIPGYRERLSVLPGMTGHAQIELGYADEREAVRAKVACDLHYVRHASLRMDLGIILRTLPSILLRRETPARLPAKVRA